MTDDVIEKVFSQQPTLDETQKAFLRKVMSLYESFATQSRERRVSIPCRRRKGTRCQNIDCSGERSRSRCPCIEAYYRPATWQESFNESRYMYSLAVCQSAYGYYLLDWADRPAAEPELREALALEETLCRNYPDNTRVSGRHGAYVTQSPPSSSNGLNALTIANKLHGGV